MAIFDNIRGLFNRGEKNVSASNSSVRSILIKRSVYIFSRRFRWRFKRYSVQRF